MITAINENQNSDSFSDLVMNSKATLDVYPKITVSDSNFDNNQKNEIISQIEKILNIYRL